MTDLDQIWEYIAEDDIDAADRVIADILNVVKTLVPFQNRGSGSCYLIGRRI